MASSFADTAVCHQQLFLCSIRLNNLYMNRNCYHLYPNLGIKYLVYILTADDKWLIQVWRRLCFANLNKLIFLDQVIYCHTIVLQHL